MSGPLRSALHVAQASIAGPSSARLIALPRPRIHLQQPSNIRTVFNFNFQLPSWPQIKAKATGSQVESTDTDEGSKQAKSEIVDGEASGSLFDDVGKQQAEGGRKGSRRFTEHRYSTATHKASHRKLNLLARQIAGHPIDEAIVQMEFSEKRASKRIKSTLALARDHAIDKGLNRARLIVAESWVSKGPKIARVDIKGRGRIGIKHHPTARLHVVLKEGKTRVELDEKKRVKALGKVRSAGVVREDGVLRRKVISGWTW